MAAGYRVDAQRWRVLFDDLMLTIGQRFRRPEPRRRVCDFVRGLLAPLPRKNCWTIAEHAGDAGPDGMQDLLTRVKWDDAEVRADVREFVGHHLGDAEAVLVIDETGDLKKGRHTVGVQRQYSGTAGKIENCQVAVHLVYATDAGHAMLDTALYLPKSWCDDPERRAEAGRRWKIEESFQAAKTGLGLDQHQNRRWTSWHRWTTLAILAHAFLAAATTHRSRPDPAGLIALTANELRHLFNILIIEPTRRHCDPLLWSVRRRRHQQRAMTSHYARQALTEP